jgi:hypothetical protein
MKAVRIAEENDVEAGTADGSRTTWSVNALGTVVRFAESDGREPPR